MTDESKTDILWILRLAEMQSDAQIGETIREMVSRLAPVAAQALGEAVDETPEDAGAAYVREHLANTFSQSFAHDLVSMTRQNDADFYDWLLSDDREELILVADSKLDSVGEEILERYLDYRDNYPEYSVIHPSAHSGPNEDDPADEWARHVSDFAWLVRDWRDGFLELLIEDVRRAKSMNGTEEFAKEN